MIVSVLGFFAKYCSGSGTHPRTLKQSLPNTSASRLKDWVRATDRAFVRRLAPDTFFWISYISRAAQDWFDDAGVTGAMEVTV
jgi:hypothetical protein